MQPTTAPTLAPAAHPPGALKDLLSKEVALFAAVLTLAWGVVLISFVNHPQTSALGKAAKHLVVARPV